VKTGPSKLERLLSSALDHAHGWRGLATLILLSCLGSPVSAQPKETLIWLLRDLPPTMILEGPKKGQGIIDQMLPLLIAGMPQYQHTLMRVNRARGMQMLHEASFTCDPSLVWTKEREQWITFSIPAFRAVSNGLVVRQEDRAVLEPFLVDGEVDLAAMLASSRKKVGVVAERSYGQFLDTLLKQALPDALTRHYGNDALGSLLQMQRLGRLQVVWVTGRKFAIRPIRHRSPTTSWSSIRSRARVNTCPGTLAAPIHLKAERRSMRSTSCYAPCRMIDWISSTLTGWIRKGAATT
jgi:uncharacterized protein (TIGR02285 family)